ncbi:MAG: hypothetical protein IJY48_04875 [Mailhella sp.]|nr:hypothetical protein [Mailhella sp.]
MNTGWFQKARRSLSALLCAALTVAVVCMAAAVFVQALAVLIIAVLAATLLLPHPLKWYAQEGADAVKLFVSELLGPAYRRDEAQDEEKAPEGASSAPVAAQVPLKQNGDAGEEKQLS